MNWQIAMLLLLGFTARSISLGQKAPPPQPPPSSGNTGTRMPMPTPSPNRGLDGLQRVMDEERMNTPEPATTPVSIADFEKTLAGNRATGDAKLATVLANFSLTERTNAVRLARWKSEFAGPKTRQILISLADASAFLSLPAEDIPQQAAPTITEQRRMIGDFAKFLSSNLPGLPNFRAVRLTTYFEDHPPRQLPLSTDPAAAEPRLNRPLRVVGTSKLQVAYVAGREIMEKASGVNVTDAFASRFTTAGEFGPILYGVMMDAAASKLAWARWETGADGLLAVFRFEAPKEKSHYSLKPPGAAKPLKQFVAYSGEIAIQPADGTIVWLSVVASPAAGDGLAEASIAVEYDKVEIGGRFYTCPVHGVALSKVPFSRATAAIAKQPNALQTELNDVSFEQYHVFRGDPHITLDTAEQP